MPRLGSGLDRPPMEVGPFASVIDPGEQGRTKPFRDLGIRCRREVVSPFVTTKLPILQRFNGQ